MDKPRIVVNESMPDGCVAFVSPGTYEYEAVVEPDGIRFVVRQVKPIVAVKGLRA